MPEIQQKLVYGVGVNDSSDLVTGCPFYRRWVHMIKRCYGSQYIEDNPTYKNCTVSDQWIYFSKFKEWMESKEWRGLHLDKDILVPGNKIYGPEFCIFVSCRINNLLLNRSMHRGEYPLGVSFCKRRRRYDAFCSVNGKSVRVGLYKTVIEASKAYVAFKSTHIRQVAYEQAPCLRDALLRHADLLIPMG